MKGSLIAIASGLIIAAIAGFYLFDTSPEEPTETADPTAVRAWFGELLEASSPAQAYAAFKDSFEEVHFNDQHNAAHIVGELLYLEEGADAVATCDASFSFGCYHGLFGRAIASEGMDIATRLDEACIEAFGPLGVGCQHGIGHGLVEYLGHDESALAEALSVCAGLSWQEELFGCQGGVFMEYNFPIIFDDDGVPRSTVRPLDIATPYDACENVPGRFQASCHFALPQWWSVELDWESIGELCATLTGAGERRACFLGMGNVIAPNTNYEPQRSIERCNGAPTERGQVYCRAGASWSFYALPETRARAPEVCDGLEADEQAFCLREAELVDEERPAVYSEER